MVKHEGFMMASDDDGHHKTPYQQKNGAAAMHRRFMQALLHIGIMIGVHKCFGGCVQVPAMFWIEPSYAD